jgi:hypothetical protein
VRGLSSLLKTAKANPIKSIVGVPIVTGILATSKSARTATTTLLSPSKNLDRGARVGNILEGSTSNKSKIVESTKTAGLIGLGAAGLVAATGAAGALKNNKPTADTVKITDPATGSTLFSNAPATPKVTETPGQVQQMPKEAAQDPVKIVNEVNVKVTPKFINNIAIANSNGK